MPGGRGALRRRPAGSHLGHLRREQLGVAGPPARADGPRSADHRPGSRDDGARARRAGPLAWSAPEAGPAPSDPRRGKPPLPHAVSDASRSLVALRRWRTLAQQLDRCVQRRRGRRRTLPGVRPDASGRDSGARHAIFGRVPGHIRSGRRLRRGSGLLVVRLRLLHDPAPPHRAAYRWLFLSARWRAAPADRPVPVADAAQSGELREFFRLRPARQPDRAASCVSRAAPGPTRAFVAGARAAHGLARARDHLGFARSALAATRPHRNAVATGATRLVQWPAVDDRATGSERPGRARVGRQRRPQRGAAQPERRRRSNRPHPRRIGGG